MLDLAVLHDSLRDEIDAAIAALIDSNAFVLGDAVEKFERNAADYLGVKHAIGVGSGTDALLLSLKAAGIGPGDEVIVPAFTFIGTVEAVLHAGASPVLADIDRRSMQIDARSIEACITSRTRAIIPVHYAGSMSDMRTILEIAEARGVRVIEDAAQAFGARQGGRFAGSQGLAGCFSFHPAKPLGGFGDGGLVTCDDDALAQTLRRLRNHGAAARHHHTEIGYTSRLDAIQAVVLDVKLRHLDAHLAQRRRLAEGYRQRLRDLPIVLPVEDAGSCHALFTIQLERRDRVREALAADGIATAVHYPIPLHHQPVLQGVRSGGRLSASEQVCERCLSLPLYEGLSDNQQQRVADALAVALRR